MVMTPQQLADLMPDATQLESDEPEMESSLHYIQLALLVTCLEWFWRDRTDFFIGANLTIYFSRQQLRNRDFRGPDFFLVKQTQKRPRKSWVVWEEDGKYPDLIIELLSDSTANVDRTLKKALYQDRFRTSEYFWFSPDDMELMGYRLAGQTYQTIAPNPAGLFWSETLELYLGVHNQQLRYFSPQGQLVQTPTEDAEAAQQQAEQARQQAEQARQRAEQLVEQLRSLGIEPDA
ncbi:MAG: Uma2 family endonuclease [Cyanobacteria bacterium CRU_2_1]|nr:Uma2 family endonuclease [Cyanobacteria bacterium RU_5_0]NJR60165.1 Uma2 family endonuclease [Cyanobacteria bacterium CRU_2_1]